MPRTASPAAQKSLATASKESAELLLPKDASEPIEKAPQPAQSSPLKRPLPIVLAFAFSAFAILLSLLFIVGSPLAFSSSTGMPAPIVATEEMKALGAQWNALRAVKGHWAGGSFNKDGACLNKLSILVFRWLTVLFI
jgi:hypothetical protein